MITSIAKARQWLRELEDGTATDIAEIATREKKHAKSIRLVLNLAFLAPDIIEAAIDSKLLTRLGTTEIARNMPAQWHLQRHILGVM